MRWNIATARSAVEFHIKLNGIYFTASRAMIAMIASASVSKYITHRMRKMLRFNSETPSFAYYRIPQSLELATLGEISSLLFVNITWKCVRKLFIRINWRRNSDLLSILSCWEESIVAFEANVCICLWFTIMECYSVSLKCERNSDIISVTYSVLLLCD